MTLNKTFIRENNLFRPAPIFAGATTSRTLDLLAICDFPRRKRENSRTYLCPREFELVATERKTNLTSFDISEQRYRQRGMKSGLIDKESLAESFAGGEIA